MIRRILVHGTGTVGVLWCLTIIAASPQQDIQYLNTAFLIAICAAMAYFWHHDVTPIHRTKRLEMAVCAALTAWCVAGVVTFAGSVRWFYGLMLVFLLASSVGLGTFQEVFDEA